MRTKSSIPVMRAAHNRACAIVNIPYPSPTASLWELLLPSWTEMTALLKVSEHSKQSTARKEFTASTASYHEYTNSFFSRRNVVPTGPPDRRHGVQYVAYASYTAAARLSGEYGGFAGACFIDCEKGTRHTCTRPEKQSALLSVSFTKPA